MSDFDKEAEREKLREKYERDEENRESTEQMSELLLKGATMTNAHCGSCGDPIFRYDGQEFCPTCEEVVTDDQAADDATAEAPADQAADDATAGAPADQAADDATAGAPADQAAGSHTGAADTAGDDAGAATGTDATAPTPDAGSAADDAPTTERTAPEAGGHRASADGRARAARPGRDGPSTDSDRSDAGATGRVSTPPETPAGADTSLASARASLARTVTKLAREAEESPDLERARAYLAATEEAADALAAVKRADR